MRRNITTSAGAQTSARRPFLISVRIKTRSTRGFVNGGHGVFERTPGCKVLSATDPTLDLLVLELVFHASFLTASFLSFLRMRLPVHTGPKNDILADRCCIERGTRSMTFFKTKLCPCPSLRHPRVNVFFHDCGADSAGDLHLLVVIVKSI